jgi:transglutaminase-like putative cysteine protease
MQARPYRVTHETRYEYEEPVTSARHLLHLTPRTTAWQTVHGHRCTVVPAPTERGDDTDFFGNGIVRLAIDRPHDELVIVTESTVEVRPRAPARSVRSPAWDAVQAELALAAPDVQFETAQYIAPSQFVPVHAELSAYARTRLRPGMPWLDALLALTLGIHADFEFDPEATTVSTPVRTVLARRKGVCQDFAHLMTSCLRSLGLPARYMSGYILTTPPPGKPRLIGADASHAWISAWCPGLGWVDFDPTNAKLADTEFVTLGWGRDFGDVTPIRGVVLGGGAQELDVRVTVLPLDEPAGSRPPPVVAPRARKA